MTDITELAQRARINAECGEHLSPAETMELVEALESEKRICATWRKTAEANSEKLEKAQAKADVYDMLRDDYGLREKGVGLADFVDWQANLIAELESRTVTAAAAAVLAERKRQVTAEGWTAERDDGYQNSELADAAACYAIHAHNQGFSTPAHWPWSQDWWKQTSPRRDLVKAGALILAEIERLDRAAGIKVEAE